MSVGKNCGQLLKALSSLVHYNEDSLADAGMPVLKVLKKHDCSDRLIL